MQCADALPEYMNSHDWVTSIPEKVFGSKWRGEKMENWKSFGLIIVVLCFLISAPAAAWHASVVKAGPEVACPTCDFYTYTITVNSLEWNEYLIEVTDTLPAGLSYVSATPAPTHVYLNTPTAGKTQVIWDFSNVPKNTNIVISLDVKPSGLTTVSNMVTSKVKASSTSGWEGTTNSNRVTTSFDEEVCPPEVPEFPSTVIPATMIIGFLGSVLFIRRIRE